MQVDAESLASGEVHRSIAVERLPGREFGSHVKVNLHCEEDREVECISREVKEELGLELRPGPLCVDWVPPHGPWDDLLAFVFDAGVLPRERIAQVQLLDGELDSFEFCDEAQAADRLRPRAWRRAQAALAAARTGRIAYLQDGYPQDAGE
jgi:8-oxo-dGTP pyrophosphatase MutT (NUDIX family)